MAIRSYYQRTYETYTPAPYTDNPVWQRYAATLHHLIASLGRDDLRGLEVGSGGGQFQHIVPGYVGVDIAASAGRFLSRPFCAASATALPFADQSFDIVWSVWTLEHVIDPEAMLREMLRVTRVGGYIFLCAAWMVPDWATRGYHLRGRKRTSLAEQILYASVYPRKWSGWPTIIATRWHQLFWQHQKRSEPGSLDYRFLLPNFETYCEYDADACISIDSAAVIQWFRDRHVRCISHPTRWHMLLDHHDRPLIFQVETSEPPAAQPARKCQTSSRSRGDSRS